MYALSGPADLRCACKPVVLQIVVNSTASTRQRVSLHAWVGDTAAPSMSRHSSSDLHATVLPLL